MRMRIPGAALTERQAQIVSLLSEGHASKEVAYRLGISARTVDNHVLEARRKTTARNVVALVAMSLREGWIA